MGNDELILLMISVETGTELNIDVSLRMNSVVVRRAAVWKLPNKYMLLLTNVGTPRDIEDFESPKDLVAFLAQYWVVLKVIIFEPI